MRVSGKRFMISVIVLLVAGCSKDNEPGGMKQQQTELRSQIDSTIAELDREMDRVRSEVQTANDRTRDELNAEMDRLQAARDDLRQTADKIAETTAENWNELTITVDNSLEQARQTLKEIKDKVAARPQNTPGG